MTGLAEGTAVKVLVDMPAARLWDRLGSMSGVVAGGTEGLIVQPAVIRADGTVWIACHSEWARDQVAGVDGYEVICEVPRPRLTTLLPDGTEGPLMEEVWVYAPASALEVVR